MIGIPMLAIISAYLLLARFITKRMPTRRWKWLAIAIFVLIPTGDTAVGYVYFRYLCATEAGNKIYRTAENVEGFFTPSLSVYFLGKFGYHYLENKSPSEIFRRYWRYSLGKNCRWQEEEVTSLKSQYGYRRLNYEHRTWQVTSYKDEIYDLRTGEVLSERVELGYMGGWFNQMLGKLIMGMGGGAIARCPKDHPDGYSNFFINTLRPIR